jgi:hypothetical protein
MEISYVNTAEDFVALSAYHVERAPTGDALKRSQRLGIISFILFGLMVALLIWGSSARGSLGRLSQSLNRLAPWVLVAGIPLALILFLALLLSSKRGQLWMIRRSAKKGTSKYLGRVQYLKLSAESLIQRSEHASWMTQWAGVTHVGSTDQHVFIYVSFANAFAVPKRAFSDEESFQAFARRAKEYHERAITQGQASLEKPNWAEAGKAFQPGQTGSGIQLVQKDDKGGQITDRQ